MLGSTGENVGISEAMSENQEHVPGEMLDADAVCAQCNTVNREGVLICRTCGNNLRDQRMVRLAAELEMEQAGVSQSRRGLLRGMLTALGILLILWTALNVNQITEWLVAIQSPSEGSVESLWADAALDALAAELEGQTVTEEESAQAIAVPATETSMEGLFVLAEKVQDAPYVPCGLALVRQEGDQLIFAAKADADTMARGYFEPRGDQFVTEVGMSSVSYEGSRFAIKGVAVFSEEGGVDCFGQDNETGELYSFKAFRVR